MKSHETNLVIITKEELQTLIIDCVSTCLKYHNSVIANPKAIVLIQKKQEGKTPYPLLRNIDISTRARNFLSHLIVGSKRFPNLGYGYCTIEHVSFFSEKEIINQRNIGEKTLVEIKEVLSIYNLKLKPSNKPIKKLDKAPKKILNEYFPRLENTSLSQRVINLLRQKRPNKSPHVIRWSGNIINIKDVSDCITKKDLLLTKRCGKKTIAVIEKELKKYGLNFKA